jgi:hypothetical protein
MKAVSFSETSLNQTTWNHMPENRIHGKFRENLKSNAMDCLTRYFKNPAQAWGESTWQSLSDIGILCEEGGEWGNKTFFTRKR